MNKPYVGRFAPTPSGGLHLGSLVVALASYLDAKSVDGRWLLRIEDLDPLRQVVGVSDQILYILEAYGFEWDGEVLYQSKRFSVYESIIEYLYKQGLAYACVCSRKQLTDYLVYPNFCRNALNSKSDAAIRIRVPALTYQFVDRLQGLFAQRLDHEVGDFVIKRRDGYYAYQLAVVLDDAEQGITNIVRGSDLLDSTPRQLYLQELLDLPSPHYLHIPILVNEQKEKLSKSLCSPIISTDKASELLILALKILGQKPVEQLQGESPQQILLWASHHWHVEYIPKQLTLMVKPFL